jgi:hypothetical protein
MSITLAELLPKGSTFLPSETDEVQGCALYAEFSDGTNTTQVFITPDGYDESGNLVRASFFRRRLNAWSPKKQWRSSYLYAHAEWENANVLRYERVETALRALGAANSTLTVGPFFVEVSREDLTLVDTYKTPTKLVYRIGQVRKALGYPELTFTK